MMIRQEIAETTRCTASAGIAENMLLARLATRSAKPNGQCFISSDKVGFDIPSLLTFFTSILAVFKWYLAIAGVKFR